MHKLQKFFSLRISQSEVFMQKEKTRTGFLPQNVKINSMSYLNKLVAKQKHKTLTKST